MGAEDTVEIRISISCWFSVTAKFSTVIEVDREEWEEMSDAQRGVYLEEECARIRDEQISVDWELV